MSRICLTTSAISSISLVTRVLRDWLKQGGRMSALDSSDLSFDEFDELHNPGPEFTDFDTVVDQAISRRELIAGSLAFGSTALIMATGAPIPAEAASRLAFEAVAANTLDTVTLPPGFRWHTVVRWGDPLWSDGKNFDQLTRGTGASQERAFGDNSDGMFIFSDNGRHVLAVNNEYTNRAIIHGNRDPAIPRTEVEIWDDIRKSKAAHGISIVEVRQRNGRWMVVKDSSLNRRITADTPFDIAGPARGHALMKTAADPMGATALGTFNNCGSGRTPWGTYLSCEENFNGYFTASDETYKPSPELKRYGIRSKDWGYGWASTDERFDVSKHPNEPNRAGYVVEIDPLKPDSKPKKLTSLGRFKHENAEVVIAPSGQIVVYMGDDERAEFLYRFVSRGRFVSGGDNSGLLEDGTLYVARFTDDMRGEWLELSPTSTGLANVAEICVHTRQAASAVGATTMDRPEWVVVNPRKPEVYCALTNNKYRGKKPNRGNDDGRVNGPNPRVGNPYGQILRCTPDDGDHAAKGFTWDLFVLAGNPEVYSYEFAGSSNITSENMFNSPDGLAFDDRGLLWIQTDGNYSNKKDYAGMGNNQMLVGDPTTGEIKRFMVGPRECEVAGLTWSLDRRTMFVGIQHPGERGNSHFPDGGKTVPRSCVIAITREDGGRMG